MTQYLLGLVLVAFFTRNLVLARAFSLLFYRPVTSELFSFGFSPRIHTHTQSFPLDSLLILSFLSRSILFDCCRGVTSCHSELLAPRSLLEACTAVPCSYWLGLYLGWLWIHFGLKASSCRSSRDSCVRWTSLLGPFPQQSSHAIRRFGSRKLFRKLSYY